MGVTCQTFFRCKSSAFCTWLCMLPCIAAAVPVGLWDELAAFQAQRQIHQAESPYTTGTRMLPVRFDDIAAADLLRLVELKTVERKTLEYKERLSTGNREERAEFLCDVCSFANASGGDMIFGISEERDDTGKPTGLPGAIKPLEIDNPATECARIEQMIESGIQPRIPLVQVKSVPLPEGGSVIVLRVSKSWIAPHMVTFSNLSRFFSRNSSTGKVQLDVQQIGAAFALQRGLGERLRNWKADRIAKAIAEEGPVPLPGAKLLFHFIPASILVADEPVYPRSFDPQSWDRASNLMTFGSSSQRYNADGFLLASETYSNTKRSYLQVFREGALEYGDSYVLDSHDPFRIPSRLFEEKLATTFQAAVQMLYFEALGMQSFGSRDKQKMTAQGAAELFWELYSPASVATQALRDLRLGFRAHGLSGYASSRSLRPFCSIADTSCRYGLPRFLHSDLFHFVGVTD